MDLHAFANTKDMLLYQAAVEFPLWQSLGEEEVVVEDTLLVPTFFPLLIGTTIPSSTRNPHQYDSD